MKHPTKLLLFVGLLAMASQVFAAAPVAIADGTLPVVYRNFASMAAKGQPRNNQNLTICLGGTNAFDKFGGWFVGTNTVSGTNTTTRIASLVDIGYSWERIQVEVDWTALGGMPAGFADGTDDGGVTYFSGSPINYANFNNQFTVYSLTNAGLSATLRQTNYTVVGQPIYLGTGTNVTIDPLIANWSWAPSTNCRFQFATNAITDTNKVYVVNVDIQAGANQQVTNVVDTLTGEGSWGLLASGLNTVTLTWKAGRWFVTQNTGKIPISQIGGGGSAIAISDGGTGATNAYGALDALNSTAETTVASATTTDLGAVASQKVQITGTTTITSFGTAAAGIKREGRFSGALTLTHNGTSLILPSAASITTAANDRFIAYSLGSGNWFVLIYQKADGTPIVGGGGGGALANTVIGAGTTAANDIAVFSDTTHTNIARSTSAGTLGDASNASYVLTFNLSGASDPTITAGNNSLTTTGTFTAGSSIYSAGASTGVGALTSTGLQIFNRFNIAGIADGDVYFSNASFNGLTRVRMGPTDSSPNNAELIGASASGTDVASGTLQLGSGFPTGNAKSGAVTIRTVPASTSSSSTANTGSIDRYIVAPELTLTDNVATSAFEISLPAGRSAGGIIRWTIEATDGTDMQPYSGVTVYAVANKAGTYTKSIRSTTTDTDMEAKATTGGTITGVWSILDGSSKVTLQFTSDTSLTTTYFRVYFTIENNSRQSITLL